MEIKDRLKILFQTQTLSQQQFADILEVAQSTLNNYLSGLSKPNFKNVMSLLIAFPNLNANWLLKGEGEMYLSNDLSNNGIINNLNQKIGTVQEDKADYQLQAKQAHPNLISRDELLEKQIELLLIEMKRLNLKMELMEKEVQKLKREKK